MFHMRWRKEEDVSRKENEPEANIIIVIQSKLQEYIPLREHTNLKHTLPDNESITK